MIVNVPWYVSNETVHSDVKISYIEDEIVERGINYRNKLTNHEMTTVEPLYPLRIKKRWRNKNWADLTVLEWENRVATSSTCNFKIYSIVYRSLLKRFMRKKKRNVCRSRNFAGAARTSGHYIRIVSRNGASEALNKQHRSEECKHASKRTTLAPLHRGCIV